jgi:hypothetical protein
MVTKRILLILFALASLNAYALAQTNFLILRYRPLGCGELSGSDLAYSSLDSQNVKALYEKYNEAGFGVWRLTLGEMKMMDSVMLHVYKNREINLFRQDTAGRFYLEIISGHNKKENKSYRVYGLMDAVLFLDRVSCGLEAINPELESIPSLRNTRDILIYDVLCKCQGPWSSELRR